MASQLLAQRSPARPAVGERVSRRRPGRAASGSTLCLGLVAAWAALALGTTAGAAETAPAARPILVKIHADWCGTCTKLESTWTELQAEYGDSVRYVVLDVTDRSAVEASRREAQQLGIRRVFDEYKSRTGTIAVVSGSTLEPVRVLKGETDAAAYRDAIGDAIAVAAAAS